VFVTVTAWRVGKPETATVLVIVAANKLLATVTVAAATAKLVIVTACRAGKFVTEAETEPFIVWLAGKFVTVTLANAPTTTVLAAPDGLVKVTASSAGKPDTVTFCSAGRLETDTEPDMGCVAGKLVTVTD
jgi:hypothetical protein